MPIENITLNSYVKIENAPRVAKVISRSRDRRTLLVQFFDGARERYYASQVSDVVAA